MISSQIFPTPQEIGVSSLTNIKYWSVAEYHQINDLGIIHPDERTELIAGQIIMMAAKGTAHVLTLRLLASVLESLLGDESVFVSTQDPIQLDNFSEPETDLELVKGIILDYVDRHPLSTRIFI
jgi:Uma2 family endonuclease